MLSLRFRFEAEVIELIFFVAIVVLDQGYDVYEIGVVGVDVAKFDLNQILYHFLSFVERLEQQRLHHFEDTLR